MNTATAHYPTNSKPAPLPAAIAALPFAERLAFIYKARRKDSRRLDFNENWNHNKGRGGKLSCKSFTTLRRSVLQPGQWVTVYLGKVPMGEAIVVASKRVLGDNLTDFECYADTGYGKTETLEILSRMYGYINAAAQEWTLATLVYIDPSVIEYEQNSLFK